MSAKLHVCEGCAKTDRATGGQPDGWVGYGVSARRAHLAALWCPDCVTSGKMDLYSRTTYRQAVAVAESRHLLVQLVSPTP